LLEHGGKLIQAARRYNIPVEEWLDLSTGLNPQPWPAVDRVRIPIDAWSRLPEEDDGLLQAAGAYYGSEQMLPVAGSQAAIQALPRLRKQASRIAILDPAYAEHAHAWKAVGFTVTSLSSKDIDKSTEYHDIIVLVNPNNPTGERFSVEQCLRWQAKLQRHGGWLIIDEAFIDSTPGNSLDTHTHQGGLIVLRSLGKFFGLAGARVGFVFAESTLLTQLAELLGPWPISGPSRRIAMLALLDKKWQTKTQTYLKKQAPRLHRLLDEHGLTPQGGSTLFQWVKTKNARAIHEQLASSGILTRLFHQPASLRFGLPATEAQWVRLELALLLLAIDNQTVLGQQA
jgi:cobalamin biosynthetic protein CobC